MSEKGIRRNVGLNQRLRCWDDGSKLLRCGGRRRAAAGLIRIACRLGARIGNAASAGCGLGGRFFLPSEVHQTDGVAVRHRMILDSRSVLESVCDHADGHDMEQDRKKVRGWLPFWIRYVVKKSDRSRRPHLRVNSDGVALRRPATTIFPNFCEVFDLRSSRAQEERHLNYFTGSPIVKASPGNRKGTHGSCERNVSRQRAISKLCNSVTKGLSSKPWKHWIRADFTCQPCDTDMTVGIQTCTLSGKSLAQMC